MERKIIRTAMIGVALGSMGMALAAPAQAQGVRAKAGDKIPNSYICVFNDQDVSRSNVRSEASRLTGANEGQLKEVFLNTIRGFSTNMSASGVERMTRLSPNIAYCEQDQVVTTAQRFRRRRGGGEVTQPAQTTPWGITRVNGGGAGSFATAWVIDSGIDLDHPDLNVDTARSATFEGSSPEDADGHGTHVAGTIAAIDNDIGVIGVAPGATVVAVRVLDDRGFGSVSGVVAGVDYVAANGSPGDVANMSLGGGASQSIDDAVLAAAAGGIYFVLAAGNDDDNANNYSPARVNGPNIYTISAFEEGDVFASFSNFGNPPVDYSEPGVNVNSTWLNGGYNTISGTSMAAPHFAGILLQSGSTDDGTVTGDPDGTPDLIRVVE